MFFTAADVKFLWSVFYGGEISSSFVCSSQSSYFGINSGVKVEPGKVLRFFWQQQSWAALRPRWDAGWAWSYSVTSFQRFTCAGTSRNVFIGAAANHHTCLADAYAALYRNPEGMEDLKMLQFEKEPWHWELRWNRWRYIDSEVLLKMLLLKYNENDSRLV